MAGAGFLRHRRHHRAGFPAPYSNAAPYAEPDHCEKFSELGRAATLLYTNRNILLSSMVRIINTLSLFGFAVNYADDVCR